MADDVKSFQIGDRVAADNSELCGHWLVSPILRTM